jgi:lipopolysaccharide/colanic/teichoic acid biosynthesis glycosyltransferase
MLVDARRMTAWPPQRQGLKRAFDLSMALLGLVVSAPAMLVIAMVIKTTSQGPVLFRQIRVGKDRQEFVLLKFRTMTDGARDELHREYFARLMSAEPCEAGVALYKLAADPRVTRIGAFLRRWSLDELPQLLNVIRGEMSMVGPRPMLPYETALLDSAMLQRFSMPAGLTGLWQVSGRAQISPRDMVALDLAYIRRWSFWNDLAIVLRTFKVVLVDRHTA